MKNAIKQFFICSAIICMFCSCNTIGGASEETVSTPVTEYLQNEILPKYNTEIDEMTAQYYCQTYGGMSGICYSTTTISNYYKLDQVEPWLLAYNIADYNADGIEDLFIITLDESGNGEIGELNIWRYIYFFNAEGNTECRCSFTTSESANEEKMIFAFIDDKLLEFSFYDFSEQSKGRESDTVVYAVTNDIRWHTSSVYVRSYNTETEELESILSYARFTHPSGVITWESEYEECNTEEEAIEKFQILLMENNISGVEIPLGTTWSDRWNDIFYLNEEVNWNAFSYDTSPAVSELCYGIEPLSERHDDMTLLCTTTGNMSFYHSKYEPKSVQNSESEVIEEIKVSETTDETEKGIQKKGLYTLEECTNNLGLFIAYEDGSFDRYRHGGYCLGLKKGYEGFEGMYLADSIADSLPQIDENVQLTLFWDSDFSVQIFPIYGEIAAIQMSDEDGTNGYGDLGTSVYMNIHYRNNTSKSVELQTINGKPSEEYVYEEVKIQVNPHKNSPSYTSKYTLTGFKREPTVTLGIAEGTKLVETTYNIDSKYYACNPDMNNWDEEDVYYPKSLATVQGYAILDFSEIPSGHYVIVIRGDDGSYIATLLDWQN